MLSRRLPTIPSPPSRQVCRRSLRPWFPATESVQRIRADHFTALRSDCFYVGAIGSRRTQERRRERLLAEGLTATELERIHGPAGLDIGAESPAETALAILAEALAVRVARAGLPLRATAQRIHVER